MLTVLYLDVIRVSQQHGEVVNGNAFASRWWQPVPQRCAVALIQYHHFMVTLSFCLGKEMESQFTWVT